MEPWRQPSHRLHGCLLPLSWQHGCITISSSWQGALLLLSFARASPLLGCCLGSNGRGGIAATRLAGHRGQGQGCCGGCASPAARSQRACCYTVVPSEILP